MSMYVDMATLESVMDFVSVRQIARDCGINENTLWSIIKRGTLDSNPSIMLTIGLHLAKKGVFLKRPTESYLEFASRVNDYCYNMHEKKQRSKKEGSNV